MTITFFQVGSFLPAVWLCSGVLIVESMAQTAGVLPFMLPWVLREKAGKFTLRVTIDNAKISPSHIAGDPIHVHSCYQVKGTRLENSKVKLWLMVAFVPRQSFLP